MTVGIGGEINEEKGYINGYCTCCRGITVHSFHDPEQKYDVSFAKDTVERVENAAKELGYVPPKRKTRKGTKREKLLVVFCPNLTNPYYVMLLQGLRHMRKKKVSAFCMQYAERPQDGRALSENDVAVKTAWNYLYL